MIWPLYVFPHARGIIVFYDDSKDFEAFVKNFKWKFDKVKSPSDFNISVIPFTKTLRVSVWTPIISGVKN